MRWLGFATGNDEERDPPQPLFVIAVIGKPPGTVSSRLKVKGNPVAVMVNVRVVVWFKPIDGTANDFAIVWARALLARATSRSAERW